MRGSRIGFVIAAAVALLWAGIALAAVDLTGGKKLKLLDRDGTGKDMAKVKFVKDAAIVAPLPDPTTEASRVRISSEDGNTGWFDLDMGRNDSRTFRPIESASRHGTRSTCSGH